MRNTYSYEELDKLIGRTVILHDTNKKCWTGTLEDLVSALDNETDERIGEVSVGLYVDGVHYEFYQSEIFDITVLGRQNG